MYKILAMDLDGTLLNPENKISENDKKAIRRLKEDGVKIILVSGREPTSVLHYSKELGLKDCIVGLNGTIIMDYTGENVIYEQNLDEEVAKDISIICEEKDIYNIAFVRNSVYVSDKQNEGYEVMKRFTLSKLTEVGMISKFMDKNNLWGNIGKLLQWGEHDELLLLQQELKNKFKGKIIAEFSMPYYLEVFNFNASKGQALKEISKKYNIDRREIVAIGDGENDISMLEYAGVGIAMGNSTGIVKEKADFVTLSNKENGISYAIKKYWGD